MTENGGPDRLFPQPVSWRPDRAVEPADDCRSQVQRCWGRSNPARQTGTDPRSIHHSHWPERGARIAGWPGAACGHEQCGVLVNSYSLVCQLLAQLMDASAELVQIHAGGAGVTDPVLEAIHTRQVFQLCLLLALARGIERCISSLDPFLDVAHLTREPIDGTGQPHAPGLNPLLHRS